jgi:hypothetical protein
VARPLPSRTSVAAAALAILLAACSAADGARSPAPAPTAAERASAAPCDAGESLGGSPLLRWTRAGCAIEVGRSYRCQPRFDPLLELDGATPRRFLGGRFAQRVPSLPDDARYLGGGDGRSLYSASGVLFSIEGGEVHRWLALPTAPPAAPPTVSVLGDSIALGSADAIAADLRSWATTIDAVVGRASVEGVPIAPTLALSHPTAVVVELGTNDQDAVAFARNAREILRSLARVPFVVWVLPHAPFSATPLVRREIDRAVGRAANAVTIDWDAAVPEDALSSDGVHLLPDRVGVFADFLARPLRAWRLAATGRGAASCATAAMPPP